MSRELRVIQAGDPLEVLAALRDALAGDGPAILPLPNASEARAAGEVPLQVAVVIETSGSTDAPKRVMLSTDALLAGAAATSVALGGPGQWVLALPTHYVAGVQVLVRSIAAGTSPLVLPPGRFDPETFADCAEQLTEPLRFTSLVPVQLARLVDTAGDPRMLSALRRFTAILVGGQAIQPALIERALALGLRVIRTYGSSETSGGCVYDGLPIGNTAVRVADGELEISGAVLAEGYLDDPARTDDRFIDDRGVRWYRTGDLGEVDVETGAVRVLGRADNVIISGGVKVSLDAVERVVRTVPGFDEAVVIPAADAEWGQVPVVVVARAGVEGRPESDRLPVPANLAGAVASVLGKAARPAGVVTVPSIPLLSSGKPDRRALRALVSPAGDPAEQ